MTNKPDEHNRKRMIHIRLDDAVHKRLKIEAVHRDTTVQGLVEDLILRHMAKERRKDPE